MPVSYCSHVVLSAAVIDKLQRMLSAYSTAFGVSAQACCYPDPLAGRVLTLAPLGEGSISYLEIARLSYDIKNTILKALFLHFYD